MPKTIFVSHSTTDDTQIDKIATALEAGGHIVWVDHRNGITPHDNNWDKAIRNAITQADVGIFVMSEAALASDICGSECLLIRELNKPLYVVRLSACKPESIWLYIKQIQYADLTTHFDTGMNAILSVLDGNAPADHQPTHFLAQFTGRETMRQYLPFLNNPLRGREADVNTVMNLLGGHVAQVIGVGGLGKSRLCAEIALAYPQGAVWHRCSAVSQAYEVADLLRNHAHLPHDTDEATVLAEIGKHKPLIVIDNAEDVAPDSEARADYVALLNRLTAYGVPVLLTSRVVWGEFKPRKQVAPAPFDTTIAVQLVADFAKSQAIPLKPSQMEELARVARVHPRLIEFAVGQLHETPYTVVIKRLETLNHEDIQIALDEMITKTLVQMRQDATHGENAYHLIHNLTWLQGTFPLEAIQALKPNLIKTDDSLIDALAVLQRYQFIRYNPTTERYQLAELVREALGTPKHSHLFNVYAKFYTSRSSHIFRDLSPDQWVNQMDDMPNIHALGDELMRRIATNPSKNDYQQARWFAKSVLRYVSRRVEMRAWRWIEMGLTAIQHLQQERPSSREHKSLTKDEALMLNNLGYIQSISGEPDKALAYYQQALTIYEAVKSANSLAGTLTNIGYVWSLKEDYDKALAYYEQALALRHLHEDKRGKAGTLNNIGSIWYERGDYAQALEYYHQALPLRREVDDKWGQATVLTNIGKTLALMGSYDEALVTLNEAILLRVAVEDKRGEAVTWHNIAKVYELMRNKSDGLVAIEKALAVTYSHDPNLPAYHETRGRLLDLAG
jgi:tetratricopeptide (TPR) repeat protein